MKRWDIKSSYPMPRQLRQAAEKRRVMSLENLNAISANQNSQEQHEQHEHQEFQYLQQISSVHDSQDDQTAFLDHQISLNDIQVSNSV